MTAILPKITAIFPNMTAILHLFRVVKHLSISFECWLHFNRFSENFECSWNILGAMIKPLCNERGLLKHRKSAKLPWRHNIKVSLWSLSIVFLSFCLFDLLTFCLFVFLSLCLFVILSFYLVVFLSFWAFFSFSLLVMLSFCHVVFLYFCLFVFLTSYNFAFLSFLYFFLFVFLSRHHADQMSEGSEVSKVTLCVVIINWHSLTDQGQV